MAIELRKERRYTFEEYLEIDDGNKYELKDGTLYMMSAPFDQFDKSYIYVYIIPWVFNNVGVRGASGRGLK